MEGLNSRGVRGEGAEEPTLRDLLLPLFRHRGLVILTFLGIFFGSIVAALISARQYEAHFLVLVKRERVDPVVSSEAPQQTPQPPEAVTEEEINSEVELLQSDDVLEKVVIANDLQNDERHGLLAFFRPSTNEDERISEAVRDLASRLQVQTVSKTDLIEVSYRTTDPKRAYDVLNSLSSFYLQKHLAVHRPAGAFDFFEQETEEYRNNLEQAEARLANFGAENKVTSAATERDLALQKLSEFEAALRNTQAEILGTERRIDDLESQLKTTAPRLTTEQRRSDNAQVLQVLEGTLAALELKQTDMMAHYDPDYPPMRDLEAQIVRAREQIDVAKNAPLREDATDVNPAYAWLTEELAKSRADLATFQASSAGTDRNVQFYRRSALELSQEELEQEDLIRNAKADEGNFLLYLNKREEARISDALDSRRILNVAIAEAPAIPALPVHSPWVFVFGGTVLAAVIGLGAAFFSDYVDPTIRTADETKKVLEIPVLAAIPRAQRG